MAATGVGHAVPRLALPRGEDEEDSDQDML